VGLVGGASGWVPTTMRCVTDQPFPRPASPSPGPGDAEGTGDWPVEATRSIVRAIDTVRVRTSGPAITAAAAVVYGLVALVAVGILAVVVTIALVRGLQLLLWGRVWLAYLVLGGLSLAGGLVCWSRRARVAP